MHYFIFPLADSTIYEDSIHQNTGLDQILELEKKIVHAKGDTPYNSRILIKFDLDDFSASMASGDLSGSDMKYYLNLYTDEAIEIPLSYTIDVYPLSSSWEMGIGKRGNNPITKTGVSWTLRDGVTISGVTGSAWETTGSDYISGSGFETSQSFEFQTTDLHVDVTDIVNNWLSGSISNHGFLIKRSDTDEDSILNQGTIQFFSKDTHTIYRPRLEVVWKDHVFNPYSSSVSYTYTEITSSDSLNVDEILSYTTNSFYTGSGIGYTTGFFTQSGYTTTWYSESYGYVTESIWSYTSSIGLYHSSSYVTSSTYQSYTYTSGSNTHISRSIISSTTTVSNFYTASLGLEFSASADTNVSYSVTPVTSSIETWTYFSTAGYYYSESFTSVTASYTYVSSSITGYSTASSSTNTALIYEIGGEDYILYMKNLKTKYRQNSRIRFRIGTRDKYPRKTFTTGSWDYTKTTQYLPTTSYYSLRDAWDEYEWVPFSDYTKLSVDATGSYFDLYLNGLEPERIYRILFKCVQNTGSINEIEQVFDKNYDFKIVR